MSEDNKKEVELKEVVEHLKKEFITDTTLKEKGQLFAILLGFVGCSAFLVYIVSGPHSCEGATDQVEAREEWYDEVFYGNYSTGVVRGAALNVQEAQDKARELCAAS